jgi:uncharacterized integral membrane protein
MVGLLFQGTDIEPFIHKEMRELYISISWCVQLLLLLLLLVFAAGPWIEAVQYHNSRAIFAAPRDDISK